MSMTVLRLDVSDLSEVKELIKKVFMRFEAPEYSDEGVAHFMTYLDEELEKEIVIEQLQLWGTKIDQQLVGVLAIRSGKHVALLFVDEAYHRQGIAKQLFQEMLSELMPEQVTVNSSPYAVPIYERLGFQIEGNEKTVSGIRFQSMVYK